MVESRFCSMIILFVIVLHIAVIHTVSTTSNKRTVCFPKRLSAPSVIEASFSRLYQQSLASSSSSSTSSNSESSRLQRARLRLAEAQGKIPIGASEDLDNLLKQGGKLSPSFTSSIIGQQQPLNKQSKVREISWRVAEPAVPYDPQAAAKQFFTQPVRWIKRNVKIFVPFTLFAIKVFGDILVEKEEERRNQRAQELLNILSAQSPAIIKAGQALASRPDLLPKEYLDELQKLQDRCPPYPTEEAIALLEAELDCRFDDVFDLPLENRKPIAAASIGQVYKAVLRSNNAAVAIKIQRPNCEEVIAIDLYVMRWYAALIQRVLKAISRDIDLVGVIDDFGDLIYREIDYRAEAVNAQRFAELYSDIPDVFVPKVYTALSTSKVLTMEWVDGARLNDNNKLERMGLDGSKFVDTLVQCTLRQMLENGFFHADPHAGNLLAMPSGKLCYLDFGMVSYVESQQRYSIIEAVVHLVNRDFNSLAELYKRMGFIPKNVDTAPIVLALEDALPDVLNAAVGELNFKNVISKLGDVMYKFPFSLPPFYIAIIRCLGVLEGVAIQVDKNFRIIEDAYPYIASRLLTDPSPELQSALQQLLFKDGTPRWERLIDLLEKASTTSDYETGQAVDQMMVYLSSEAAMGEGGIKQLIVEQLIEVLDQLGSSGLEVALSLANPEGLSRLLSTIFEEINSNSGVNGGSLTDSSGRGSRGAVAERQMIEVPFSGPVDRLAAALADAILARAKNATSGSVGDGNGEAMVASASRTLQILRSSGELTSDKFIALARKIIREPVAQEILSEVVSELSERAAARVIKRIFSPFSAVS